MFKTIFLCFKAIINNWNQPPNIEQIKNHEVSLRVMPWHLDLNFHVNNAKYFSYCNQARFVFMLDTKILSFIFRRKFIPVIKKMEVQYLKSLMLFQKFKIITSLVEVQKGFLLLEHQIIDNSGALVARVKCQVCLLKKNEYIDHEKLFENYFNLVEKK